MSATGRRAHLRVVEPSDHVVEPGAERLLESANEPDPSAPAALRVFVSGMAGPLLAPVRRAVRPLGRVARRR